LNLWSNCCSWSKFSKSSLKW